MKETYYQMTERYPNVYKVCRYIECGEGWYDILNALSQMLESLIIELDCDADEKPHATQVKEKYGTLRFYLSQGTEDMFKAIEESESASSKICEACGEQGKIMLIGGWYCTRCDTCRNKT